MKQDLGEIEAQVKSKTRYEPFSDDDPPPLTSRIANLQSPPMTVSTYSQIVALQAHRSITEKTITVLP
jgi:hypothetical protein